MSPVRTPKHPVLIVDDEPDIATSLTEFIETRIPSIHVLMETSSRRAIQLLRREAFVLVVSDYRMPEFDGIEVLRAAAR